jgi:hypothetical protein
MLSQKEAVFNTVTQVLQEHNVLFEKGMVAKTLLTPEMKKSIVDILVCGFTTKQIQLDKEVAESNLTTYTRGLVSNWLNKDNRLNGDHKYVPSQNVKTSGNQMLDETMKLLRVVKGTFLEKDVRRVMDSLKKPSAASKLDASLIPEHLRHLLKDK